MHTHTQFCQQNSNSFSVTHEKQAGLKCAEPCLSTFACSRWGGSWLMEMDNAGFCVSCLYPLPQVHILLSAPTTMQTAASTTFCHWHGPVHFLFLTFYKLFCLPDGSFLVSLTPPSSWSPGVTFPDSFPDLPRHAWILSRLFT